MRNKIFGLIGVLWGGAILFNGLLSDSSGGSEAYQSGQSAAVIFGGLMFVVGLYYLLKKST